MKVILAILGLVSAPLAAEATRDGLSYFEQYEANRATFEAQGVTERMFLMGAVYLESQYMAGYCGAHLSDDELELYRQMKLRGTGRPNELIQRGDNSYRDGLRDGLRELPTATRCFSVLRDLETERQAILRYVDALPPD